MLFLGGAQWRAGDGVPSGADVVPSPNLHDDRPQFASCFMACDAWQPAELAQESGANEREYASLPHHASRLGHWCFVTGHLAFYGGWKLPFLVGRQAVTEAFFFVRAGGSINGLLLHFDGFAAITLAEVKPGKVLQNMRVVAASGFIGLLGTSFRELEQCCGGILCVSDDPDERISRPAVLLFIGEDRFAEFDGLVVLAFRNEECELLFADDIPPFRVLGGHDGFHPVEQDFRVRPVPRLDGGLNFPNA